MMHALGRDPLVFKAPILTEEIVPRRWESCTQARAG